MIIVGVIGFAGSGKDTVGDMFVEAGYKKVSFASTLKDAVSTIFGWDRELLEGSTKQSREWREQKDDFWTQHLGYDVTPRLILQRFGTEACRNALGENIWVYSLLRNLNKDGKYVITDVRFPNEIAMIKSVDGKLIRVRRGPDPVWYEAAKQQNTGESTLMDDLYPGVHPSEYSWIGTDVDYVINNQRGLDDLKVTVNSCIDLFEFGKSPTSRY